MRLQTLIIATLVCLTVSTVLIQMVFQFEGNYGISSNGLTNDSNIGDVISNITTLSQFTNDSIQSSSYTPGQPNALVVDSTNPTSSIQQSSFTSILKYIPLMLTIPKLLIITFGNYIGIDPTFLLAFSLGLIIVTLLFLASLLFFRPA